MTDEKLPADVDRRFNERYSWNHDRVPYYILEDDAKEFLAEELAKARADERARVRKIIEESRWECYEHGLPKYEKTDCVECNSALEINVVLEALLSSLDKSVNIKD